MKGCVVLVFLLLGVNLNVNGQVLKGSWKLIEKFRSNKVPLLPTPRDILVGEFEQPLDHFNTTETRTFIQSYYEDDINFEPGGPVFIFVSAGGENINTFTQFSNMRAISNELNGLMIALEPRFYNAASNIT